MLTSSSNIHKGEVLHVCDLSAAPSTAALIQWDSIPSHLQPLHCTMLYHQTSSRSQPLTSLRQHLIAFSILFPTLLLPLATLGQTETLCWSGLVARVNNCYLLLRERWRWRYSISWPERSSSKPTQGTQGRSRLPGRPNSSPISFQAWLVLFLSLYMSILMFQKRPLSYAPPSFVRK